MKARLIIPVIAGLLSWCLFVAVSSTANNPSSCVTCHTDESMLKKTCKPFVMPVGEAEG